MPLRAAALDAELWDAARRAFTLANAKRLAVRSVALTLDRLVEAEAQLELWEEDEADASRWRSAAAVHGAHPYRSHRYRPLTACRSRHALDRIQHSGYGTRTRSAVIRPLSVRSQPPSQTTTTFRTSRCSRSARCASASSVIG